MGWSMCCSILGGDDRQMVGQCGNLVSKIGDDIRLRIESELVVFLVVDELLFESFDGLGGFNVFVGLTLGEIKELLIHFREGFKLGAQDLHGDHRRGSHL